MNIREMLNFSHNYSYINREERNLAVLLYHALLTDDNIRRFIALLDDCKVDVMLNINFTRDNIQFCLSLFHIGLTISLWYNDEDLNRRIHVRCFRGGVPH